MIGQIMGAYRISSVVGEGGMGTVYLAEHTLIGHRAAIKVLKAEYSHRPEVVDRFFNEARAASGIRHPGIVEIYDFGYHADNAAYIVMEHLNGESLHARLHRRVRLPVDQALYLTRHVASGLAAAHDQSIVHRDLKPDNIFIVSDPDIPGGERTKILDFGIAKLAAQTPGSFKTSTGTVMGTPAYMAPEQCKGAGRVDNRADLYALGCILFEMLCGRPPFVAEGGGEVMAQHIYEPAPSPRRFDPELGAEVEALVLRLMAKDPGQRYQSAREVLAAIDQLLAGLGGVPATVATEPATPAVTPTPPPAASTTLGSAAGPMPPAGRPQRRAGYLAPLLVGVTLTGAGIAFLAVRGGDQVASEAAAGQDALAALSPPMAHDAAAPTNGDAALPGTERAAPADITVLLDSTPTRAEVYRMPEMIRVGVTPYRLSLPPADGELVFVLRRRGYDTETVVLPADQDSRQTIGLHRSSPARVPGKRPDDTRTPPAATGDKPPPPSGKPPAPSGKPTPPPIDAGSARKPPRHVLDPFDKEPKPKGRSLDPFHK